jgi:hypothetical protein
MPGHECYHCKQWVEEGAAHDCWTTTEAALTEDLSEDLRDAWERLREAALELGEQRIYASHNSIMFARKTCYLFVRPKKNFLEVCVFLGRRVAAPQVRRADQSSKTKVAHIIQVRHRDEVEAPITDWIREAYELPDVLAARVAAKHAGPAPGAGRAAKPAARNARPAAGNRKAAARKRGPIRKTGSARKTAGRKAKRR